MAFPSWSRCSWSSSAPQQLPEQPRRLGRWWYQGLRKLLQPFGDGIRARERSDGPSVIHGRGDGFIAVWQCLECGEAERALDVRELQLAAFLQPVHQQADL